MSQVTTLGEVRAQVEQKSLNHWDDYIPVKDIQFVGLQKNMIHGDEHVMRSAAQRAICNRLGVPIQYLQKCDPLLQAVNLNEWLPKERNDNLFVRFDGNDIRAIFTPRYKPIDNLQVLDRLYEQGYDDDNKIQCSLDDEFFMLNIPDKEKSFQVRHGDQMEPGISIGNSEVGMSSLTIAAFVLRLICTNGLISKSSVESSYRHVSHRILNEFPQVLNQVTMDLNQQRDQWEISADSHVDNPEGTIRSFNRQYNLDKQETEAVDWAWSQESGETMFDIVNTYTKAAQHPQLPSESEYQLQKVGGNILAMMN